MTLPAQNRKQFQQGMPGLTGGRTCGKVQHLIFALEASKKDLEQAGFKLGTVLDIYHEVSSDRMKRKRIKFGGNDNATQQEKVRETVISFY